MNSHDVPEYWDYIESAWETIEIHQGPEAFLTAFRAAPTAAANLVAAHWLVSEVRNGAFPQFFSNSTGVLAPEAADALEHIGLSEAAEILKAAMTFFDEPYPRDRAIRQQMIDWVWRETLSDDEAHNLDIMLDLSGRFLDALGKDAQRFTSAANTYARANLGPKEKRT